MTVNRRPCSPSATSRHFSQLEGSLFLQSPARLDLVGVRNRQALPTFNRELWTVNFSLGPITCIDADVLRSEVASPVASHGFTCVQIHDHGNVFGKKFVAGGALVEIERLAAPQGRDARHLCG